MYKYYTNITQDISYWICHEKLVVCRLDCHENTVASDFTVKKRRSVQLLYDSSV